jgi:LysM repeat protein
LFYTVRSGDTLYGIALSFGTSIDAIARQNQIDPNDILHIDQQLIIPVEGFTPTADPIPAESPSSTSLDPELPAGSHKIPEGYDQRVS